MSGRRALMLIVFANGKVKDEMIDIDEYGRRISGNALQGDYGTGGGRTAGGSRRCGEAFRIRICGSIESSS